MTSKFGGDPKGLGFVELLRCPEEVASEAERLSAAGLEREARALLGLESLPPARHGKAARRPGKVSGLPDTVAPDRTRGRS